MKHLVTVCVLESEFKALQNNNKLFKRRMTSFRSFYGPKHETNKHNPAKSNHKHEILVVILVVVAFCAIILILNQFD